MFWSERTETCRSLKRDMLSVSCSVLYFNKECICWCKNFECFLHFLRMGIRGFSDLLWQAISLLMLLWWRAALITSRWWGHLYRFLGQDACLIKLNVIELTLCSGCICGVLWPWSWWYVLATLAEGFSLEICSSLDWGRTGLCHPSFSLSSHVMKNVLCALGLVT
jgi:hypothetical protein